MLDIAADTWLHLQAAFTTGYLAGKLQQNPDSLSSEIVYTMR